MMSRACAHTAHSRTIHAHAHPAIITFHSSAPSISTIPQLRKHASILARSPIWCAFAHADAHTLTLVRVELTRALCVQYRMFEFGTPAESDQAEDQYLSDLDCATDPKIMASLLDLLGPQVWDCVSLSLPAAYDELAHFSQYRAAMSHAFERRHEYANLATYCTTNRFVCD